MCPFRGAPRWHSAVSMGSWCACHSSSIDSREPGRGCVWRAGTGKTTLARGLARAFGACYLRVDAVETALQRTGLLVGPECYAVVHELAVSNLLIGVPVVVDAVHPVPEARQGWAATAARANARLIVLKPACLTSASIDVECRNVLLTSRDTRCRLGLRFRAAVGFRGMTFVTARGPSSARRTRRLRSPLRWT